MAGDPLLITYCPLCGSGIAYERTFGDAGVEFGTTGKLYNSNLVMYDRATDTYWSQISGQAIIGELTGMVLTPVTVDTVVWRDWMGEHADAEVLSQDTGFFRDYGDDPYGDYYEDSFIWFPVTDEDDRIHAKTVIFGIEVGGVYKAYQEDDLMEHGDISDTVAGVEITVRRDAGGSVAFTESVSGDEIVKERDFWFAWYAFHPETELYAP